MHGSTMNSSNIDLDTYHHAFRVSYIYDTYPIHLSVSSIIEEVWIPSFSKAVKCQYNIYMGSDTIDNWHK